MHRRWTDKRDRPIDGDSNQLNDLLDVDGLGKIDDETNVGQSNLHESYSRRGSLQDEDIPITLHELACKGDATKITKLLGSLSDFDRLAVVNELDELDCTPLHHAVRYNQYLSAKLLIDNGADVKLSGQRGLTALHSLARWNRRPSRPLAGGNYTLKKNRSFLVKAGVEISEEDDELFFTPKQTLPPKLLVDGHDCHHQSIGPQQSNTDRYGHSSAAEEWTMVLLLDLLLEQGADPNAKDASGMTPLHHATIRGNKTFVAEIVRRDNVDKQVIDRLGQTPLHCACACGHVDICGQLMDAGVSVDAVDVEFRTPLHLASSAGHLALIERLLNKIDPDHAVGRDQTQMRMKYGQLLDARDIGDNTALMLAASNGHCEIVAFLLKRRADVNAVKRDGTRSLHLAAINGNPKLISLLIDHGAKVDCQTTDRETPMWLACFHCKTETVSVLIDKLRAIIAFVLVESKGANVSLRDRKKGRTALLTACASGSAKCVRALISKFDSALEELDQADRTALFLAARHNRLEVLKYLLSGDVSDDMARSTPIQKQIQLTSRDMINRPDRYGMTPLHSAASNGHVDIVKCLLEYGAQLDSKDDKERTPLHLAAYNGHQAVVALLCSTNAKLCKEQDEDMNTPLHLAAKHGHTVVAKTLLAFGVPAAARNVDYWTPLHFAAHKGWTTTISVLLDNSVPVDLPDKTKATPLHIACTNGNIGAVRLLLKRKADLTALTCDDRNALELAIEHDHKHVIQEIIASDDWRSAFTHAFTNALGTRQTPLRSLIKSYPEAAKMVFDKLVITNNLPEEHPDFQMSYNFELLDDTYCKWVYEHNATHSSFFADNYAEIKRNHPLMIMVLCQREQLLDHPLVRSLLKHKWRQYGRYFYYGALWAYLLFLLALTWYLSTAEPPYEHILHLNTTLLDENCSSGQIDPVKNDGTLRFSKYAVKILAIANLIKETFQLLLRRTKYIELENIIEWFIYVAAIIFVSDFAPCAADTHLRLDWQWQLGAISVFLAWMNLVFFASKLPRYGIYVVMFTDILNTFSRFFVLYSLFIIAFALMFYALFQNQVSFSTVQSSILKTIVMMVGELDYSGIFNKDPSLSTNHVIYDDVSRFFFIVFILIMAILTMNLLIGLAVDDIKAVQQQAVLKRLALQVQQVLEVEQLTPERFRRRWTIAEQIDFPNRKQKTLRTLLGKVLATRSQLLLRDREQDTAERTLKTILELTNAKIDQLQKSVSDLRKEQGQLKKVFADFVKNNDVSVDDWDPSMDLGL